MLAAAALDRLLHRGVIVAIDGPSYRMRAHQQRADTLRKATGPRTGDPAMTAEQRPCPACGTAFTWTPASPRQAVLQPPDARLAWWGARRRQATAALRRGDIGLPAGQPHGNDPRTTGNDARGDDARSHAAAGTLAAIPGLPALPAARRDRRLARATGRGQHRHAATIT